MERALQRSNKHVGSRENEETDKQPSSRELVIKYLPPSKTKIQRIIRTFRKNKLSSPDTDNISDDPLKANPVTCSRFLEQLMEQVGKQTPFQGIVNKS